MKALLILLCSLLAISSLESNNKNFILEGTLINSGLMLKNKDGIIEFTSHGFGMEFSELSTQKIRILCEKFGKKCRPLRYDIEPFIDSSDAPDWALKRFPRYVTRGEFAFNPQVTPDGGKMFWTTLIKTPGTSRSSQKIWTSEKDEYGFWKAGWQMESPLNNPMPSAVISALPGGNELFIFGNFGEDTLLDNLKTEMDAKASHLVKTTKSRKEFEYRMNQLKSEHNKKSELIFNRSPLYKSQRDKNYWSMPTPLDFPSFYNTYKKPENPNQQIFGGAAISSSGKTLIFSAQQRSNYGKLDLYVSFMNSKGEFGDAINMGSIINSSEEEMAPFLGPDDKTLYFSSSGQSKDLSIFVTKRIGNSWTNWSAPREISSKLRGVNFFSIPARSEWAYVSRDGELFMAKIPLDYRPETVTVVQGKTIDTNGNPVSAEIRYESLDKNIVLGRGVSDPKTGSFSLILPFGENYGFFAEKDGYLPVSVNMDLKEVPKGNSDTQKIKDFTLVLPKIEKGMELTLNNLFFETGSSDIAKESEPELQRLAIILQNNPKLEIILEGHTDDVGKIATNLELSLARANSVKQYLTEAGKIPSERILTKGYGSKKPVVENSSDENRAKNRRVVFRIKD